MYEELENGNLHIPFNGLHGLVYQSVGFWTFCVTDEFVEVSPAMQNNPIASAIEMGTDYGNLHKTQEDAILGCREQLEKRYMFWF